MPPVSQDAIYQRPDDYDLEHAGNDEDSRFYCRVRRRFRPRRVLELGCGSGRVTLALATALPESRIVGLDRRRRCWRGRQAVIDAAVATVRNRVTLEAGDMRTWIGDGEFDAIVVPCCSVSHLLTMDDRRRTWRNCCRLLTPAGALLIDVRMPDLATLAESQRIAPRALLQLDVDSLSGSQATRLLRSLSRSDPDQTRGCEAQEIRRRPRTRRRRSS